MAVAWQILRMPKGTPTRDTTPAAPSRTGKTVIEISRGSTTIKVYRVKNRGRNLFMVTWFVAGRRYRKNFSAEKEAREAAAAIADQLSRGQAQALSLTGADRDNYVHAQSLLRHLGIPLLDAVRDYVAAMKLLKGHPLLGAVQHYVTHAETRLPEKRVSDLYTEFLAQQEADGRSIRYVQDIRSRLGRFAEAFSMNIGDVETATLDKWLRSLGVSGRTRLNFRVLLVTFFKFARQVGYLPKGFPTAADDLPKPKAEDEEIEIYTQKELQTLIDHSDSHTLPVLCLGAFAGLRTAEIERLHWESIKWKEDIIEIQAKSSKTRRRRLIPILAPLRAGLFQCRNRSGPVVDHIKLQYRLRSLADEAEVERRSNALRHSFASYRVADIQHVEQVALEMGNSPSMIFEHYRQLVTKADAAAWWNPKKWKFAAL